MLFINSCVCSNIIQMKLYEKSTSKMLHSEVIKMTLTKGLIETPANVCPNCQISRVHINIYKIHANS